MNQIDIKKLVELAGEEAEVLQEDLYRFTNMIVSDFTLMSFIEDISKPGEVRRKVIEDAFPSSSKIFKKLVPVLIKEEFCRSIPEISEEVTKIVAGKLNVRFDELIFSEKPEENLLSKFAKMTDGKVKFRVRIDPAIMGGFIWKTMDGKVLNASIAGRLSAIKEEITA
ncbi:MAG: F0F1 ATP synthase subunit delta [Candidatus Margulisiibacteriota bacterium]